MDPLGGDRRLPGPLPWPLQPPLLGSVPPVLPAGELGSPDPENFLAGHRPASALADAAATAIGNLIIQSSDIPDGIEFAKGIEGLLGVIIIKDDNMGVWGEVKICSTSV